MSVEQAISKAEAEFNKIVDHLKMEYARLQVGRASTLLVEDIHVELYGVTQPIKAVASISVPDARTIQIQPWDRSALAPIEKAIVGAGTGLNPVSDGIVVRISIPPLTQESREKLTKTVKKLAEEARIAIRNSRQEAHNQFKTLKADSVITEDDWHSADKKLQAKVDAMNDKVEQLAKDKEKDVMTV